MAWMGTNWVPDGTPGATQGAPTGTTAVKLPTFQGYQPPFRKDERGFLKDKYYDANGREAPYEVVVGYHNEEVAKKQAAGGPPSGSSVSPGDLTTALDQYRGNIAKAQEQYGQVAAYRPDPSARAVVTPVVPNTAQSDLSRGLQLGAAGYLDQSAQGLGAVKQIGDARMAQGLRAGAQQASGIAQGSVGAARKGAARAGVLAANQAGMDAGYRAAELQGTQALNAQGQLAAALQGVRAGDISQQSVGVQAAQGNNQTNLDAWRSDEDIRLRGEDLKLRVADAATRAAAGLLGENERAQNLAFAQQQWKVARDDRERDFWRGIITSLVSRTAGAALTGATGGAAA
jgi:hypothetical protein